MTGTFMAQGSYFAPRVYRDEPIIATRDQPDEHTPPEYPAMRRLADRKGARYESDARIFYKQGKFMESFEDEYEYHGEFSRYFPTYQSMNIEQLRGYFSWRTKVRRGIIAKTSISFAYVYIYELLNQIGVRSPEIGFITFKNFWRAYRELDGQIDRYTTRWLIDYVVYYNLDKSSLDGLPNIELTDEAVTLQNYKSCSSDEVFSALYALSPYNLKGSRFYKLHADEVKDVVCYVYDVISTYFEKIYNKPCCEKLFGKFFSSYYHMFDSAVFYSQKVITNFTYEINSLQKYECKDGYWTFEKFYYYGGKKQLIGELLKTVDYFLRQKYNFKSAFKPGKTDKMLNTVIEEAINECLRNKREAARPKIEIDVLKLQDIRKTALETQRKLIVPEPEEPEIHDKQSSRNESGLGDAEYLLMRRLLYGGTYSDIIMSKHPPLSVLTDAVNEFFFDKFGDNVIIETEGRPELVTDYVEELRGLIKE